MGLLSKKRSRHLEERRMNELSSCWKLNEHWEGEPCDMSLRAHHQDAMQAVMSENLGHLFG